MPPVLIAGRGARRGEREDPAVRTRARAQSFLALVTLGIGTAIGSLFANAVYVSHTVSATEHDWKGIWLIPAVMAVVTAAVFALFFREKKKVEIDTVVATSVG